MPSTVPVMIGGSVAVLWGVAHLLPTRGVVAGFGQLSTDNRLVITMEWAAEGLALIFVGALPLLVTALAGSHPVAIAVDRACAGMLLVMAAWTGLTGARSSIRPIKVCPFVKTAAAALIVWGTIG